ncbi:hypothetical protein, partial [Plasmodium yoelii yoelii]
KDITLSSNPNMGSTSTTLTHNIKTI